MTTSALDIITDALNELGVYAAGEPISSADSAQVLDLLNRLIDAWNDEGLIPTYVSSVVGALASGTASYQVGAGSAFAPPSYPFGIEYGLTASVTVGATTTLVNVVSGIEWNSIYSLSPTAGTPEVAYYQPDFPTGTVFFAPTPNATATATIPFTIQLPQFPNISTNYTLSLGIKSALIHNLCILTKPYFSTAVLDPAIAAMAGVEKNTLFYTNRTSRAWLGRDKPFPPVQSRVPPA